MPKILAIIEPHHHSEVLRTFAQIFLHIGWQVRIFTNKQVHNDCYELREEQKIQWYLQAEESNTQFISQQRTIIDECDLAIFVTLVSDFSFFTQLKLAPKKILVIHNGNTFFDAAKNWSISSKVPNLFKDCVKLLRFIAFQENTSRQKMLANFDYLSLASSSMQDYFKDKKEITRKYNFIDPLPFTFFEGIPPEAIDKKEVIEIAIPGTVKEEGKDYELVLAAFRQIVPELKQVVKLIFLGGAQSKYAQGLIRRFQEIENEFFQIQYTPGFISQQNFDVQLRRTDFLILPIKKSYRLGIIREYYGHTNISGGINDLIRFGVPALITSDYPLEKAICQMTRGYDSQETFIVLLKEWIEKKSFVEIRRNAPESLADYRKEILAEKMKITLLQ